MVVGSCFSHSSSISFILVLSFSRFSAQDIETDRSADRLMHLPWRIPPFEPSYVLGEKIDCHLSQYLGRDGHSPLTPSMIKSSSALVNRMYTSPQGDLIVTSNLGSSVSLVTV